LPAVEINSSFYRPHKRSTYERWAASTPPGFRFAVKVPRTITHNARLADESFALVAAFLDQVAGLGAKLGPLLVQLPPSLRFEEQRASRFFSQLRDVFEGFVVCEPRHDSWFSPAADTVLERSGIGRVAADPPPTPGAETPRPWGGLAYYRLHGSPVIYESAYRADVLRSLEEDLFERAAAMPVWCIFDNTAAGAATPQALEVWRRWLVVSPNEQTSLLI
jgi:uncharacterized protein YecE (DUF72 family)